MISNSKQQFIQIQSDEVYTEPQLLLWDQRSPPGRWEHCLPSVSGCPLSSFLTVPFSTGRHWSGRSMHPITTRHQSRWGWGHCCFQQGRHEVYLQLIEGKGFCLIQQKKAKFQLRQKKCNGNNRYLVFIKTFRLKILACYWNYYFNHFMSKDDHPYCVLPVHFVSLRGKQKDVDKPRGFLQEELEVEESFNHWGFSEFCLSASQGWRQLYTWEADSSLCSTTRACAQAEGLWNTWTWVATASRVRHFLFLCSRGKKKTLRSQLNKTETGETKQLRCNPGLEGTCKVKTYNYWITYKCIKSISQST